MPPYSYHILLFSLLTVTGTSVFAQTIPKSNNDTKDSVITVILPAVAYASDLGLVGGGIINRYHYHPSSTPFLSLAELSVLASTKGMIDALIRYEHTNLLGRQIRSRWTLYGQRFPQENYFGIGNNTTFDADAWNNEFYFYEAKRIGLEWISRKNVYKPQSLGGQIDVMAKVLTDYEVSNDHGGRMALDRPVGFEGGWVTAIGIGMIWENRNNEYNATQGNRFELSGEWAPGLILGNSPMATISSEYRQYLTLPIPYFRPVLATRLSGKWATGDIPYWKRPYLGDEKTLRGYPIYRFRGDSAVFYNIELRTWIFELPYYDFKFGIHGFHDAGRVFYQGDGIGQIFQNHHRTFGGGVATTMLTPDFILRLDIGYSDEMSRIYMKIGYMF